MRLELYSKSVEPLSSPFLHAAIKLLIIASPLQMLVVITTYLRRGLPLRPSHRTAAISEKVQPPMKKTSVTSFST